MTAKLKTLGKGLGVMAWLITCALGLTMIPPSEYGWYIAAYALILAAAVILRLIGANRRWQIAALVTSAVVSIPALGVGLVYWAISLKDFALVAPYYFPSRRLEAVAQLGRPITAVSKDIDAGRIVASPAWYICAVRSKDGTWGSYQKGPLSEFVAPSRNGMTSISIIIGSKNALRNDGPAELNFVRTDGFGSLQGVGEVLLVADKDGKLESASLMEPQQVWL